MKGVVMKKGIFLVILFLALSGCDKIKQSDSVTLTKEQLVSKIMEAPGLSDAAIAEYNKATQKEREAFNEKNTQILSDLKTDLRKLHVLDPALAEKIVDENFPMLLKGKAPIWIKKPVVEPQVLIDPDKLPADTVDK
jgi:hypothetical protein